MRSALLTKRPTGKRMLTRPGPAPFAELGRGGRRIRGLGATGMVRVSAPTQAQAS